MMHLVSSIGKSKTEQTKKTLPPTLVGCHEPFSEQFVRVLCCVVFVNVYRRVVAECLMSYETRHPSRPLTS